MMPLDFHFVGLCPNHCRLFSGAHSRVCIAAGNKNRICSYTYKLGIPTITFYDTEHT